MTGFHDLVIAGWTGRDEVALRKHIRELEEIGVKPPKTTPIFYRVSANLLTTAAAIQVSGPGTSGEVEFVLLSKSDGLWVTVGSDHTDRKAEIIGVSLSKQLCAKPMSTDAWRYDEVKPHWEKLVLRSWSDGELYQEGAVTAMMDPRALIGRHAANGRLGEGTLMFCGTLAAHGGVRATGEFAFEIEDPVFGRKIAHAYRVRTLPILG